MRKVGGVEQGNPEHNQQAGRAEEGHYGQHEVWHERSFIVSSLLHLGLLCFPIMRGLGA